MWCSLNTQNMLYPCIYLLWINHILIFMHICTLNGLKFKAGILEDKIEKQ